MPELLIYDEIGLGDCSAKTIRQRLAEMTGDLTVRVNSPGGDVYAGISIMNALRSYEGTVTAIIEGLAASAASFIAIGGADTTRIYPNAEIMIHDALTLTQGNAEQITETAATLNRLSDSIASIYAAKAGGNADQWRDIMRAETWYTAQEALDAGLVDAIEPTTTKAHHPAFTQVRARYKYPSRHDAPPPKQLPTKTKGHNVSILDNLINIEQPPAPTEAPTLTIEQWLALTQAVGLQPTATVDELVAAVEEVATSTAQEIQQAAAKLTSKQPITNNANAAVMIDRRAWNDMKRAISRGLTLDQQENRLQAEQVIDQGIRYGKITPTQREKWIASYLQDPDSTLTAINRGKEIPRVERGYSHYDEEADSGDKKAWVR